MEQVYKLNGVNVNFNKSTWLEHSLGILRKDMPQVNMTAFYKILPFYQQYLKIDIESVPVNVLLPIQCEIDYNNVLVNAATKELSDDQLIFICSKDYHIIDGHHRCVQCMITDPERLVMCYKFDLSAEELLTLIKKTSQILDDSVCINGENQSTSTVSEELQLSLKKMLLEDFGMQGPESVPGIGNVVMPDASQTTGDVLDKDAHGSGDIPCTVRKKDYDALIKAMRKRQGLDENTGESLFGKTIDGKLYESLENLFNEDAQNQLIVESMGDITPVEWVQMRRDAGDHEGAERTIKLFNLQDNSVQESSNGFVKYEIVCRDSEKSLLNILKHIKDIGNTGHSMTIVVDEGEDDEKKFGWDGDGDDTIQSIKVIDSVDEALNEDGNLKLDRHFENADGLELKTCINKPVQRKCLVIDEPFSCNTLEGITQGKAGDVLIVGIDNEIYPCDKDIFDATYMITGELEETKETKENNT